VTSECPDPDVSQPCIYCGSTTPPKKREHVMSQALGRFEQNWTLDCVCDECNQYFADNLELPLGRDSREALFRIDLGLKPAAGAAELLNRRVKTSLRDPAKPVACFA
jgi:HNH endonuclease